MLSRVYILLAALLASSSLPCIHGADWPGWRGPSHNGISPESDLPLRWSETENVRWKVPLPGPGNSTPITWGDRIFLTQSIPESNRRELICLDRKDGKILWRSAIEVAEKERTHETNPHASSSPVTDGERVICWFGSGGLVCYDFQGKELWRKDLGQHDHQFGYGGSPVLHGDLCFLNFGPGRREFLVAVKKQTGEEVWRHQSPVPGEDDIYGSWGTPHVTTWKGKTQVISFLRDQLAAFEPQTGDLIWEVRGVGIQAKTSPVAGEGVVVWSGDLKSSEVAVRLGGKGNVGDTHVLWRKDPPKRRVATGIIHEGHLYGVQTMGIADCLDLQTGRVIWEERLTGTGANKAVWSSPVLAGERLYIMNQSGEVFVLKASPQYELLAVNSLNQRSNSDVVPSNGELFLRTHQALWCISEPQAGKR